MNEKWGLNEGSMLLERNSSTILIPHLLSNKLCFLKVRTELAFPSFYHATINQYYQRWLLRGEREVKCLPGAIEMAISWQK